MFTAPRTLPAAAVMLALTAGCSSEVSSTAGPPPPRDASTTDAKNEEDGGPAEGGSCVPASCSSLGAQCGASPDGCAGVVQCGTCPEGEFCGGAGPNRCGKQPCTPATCAASACGEISDGCSATINCGACVAPSVCGGGGVPNVCGCSPTGCGPYKCGFYEDGCGGVIDCGSCAAPQTCGGGGNIYECGCTPVGCSAAALCDASGNNQTSTKPVDNGCGGQVFCGACCSSGQFCSGSQTITEWKCACGNPGVDWVPQDEDCFHRATPTPC